MQLQLQAKFTIGRGGDVAFQKADERLDFAPATEQPLVDERVPFLFSLKELNGKGKLISFSGDFTVPFYKGSSFLDLNLGA